MGTGPCGELRLPSYVEANGWRFPGAGEFQCYDRRALASLAQAAKEAGHAEWGYGGPHDAGSYNSTPEHTGFFRHNGSWESPYGRWVALSECAAAGAGTAPAAAAGVPVLVGTPCP